MTAHRTAPVRQSVAALTMAATMTLGLLAAIGQIADHAHADARLVQGTTPAAQQLVAAEAGTRS